MTYTFEQYEKFFDNFEGSNAGMIYKPRTFCSTRLYALMRAILNNIENEDAIKNAISSDLKLGDIVVELMYGSIEKLNKLILGNETNGYIPDFIDAIKRWRDVI